MKQKTVIRIENLGKTYELGKIGGTTIQRSLQSWWALRQGKDDPNRRIGQRIEASGRFQALRGVTCEIYEGERVAIIGRNGAGKSTLLKLLSRVTAPSVGEIRVAGRISSMLEVGTGFHGELTGRENIYLNGAILGMSQQEVAERIDEIIAFSECEQFIHFYLEGAREISGLHIRCTVYDFQDQVIGTTISEAFLVSKGQNAPICMSLATGQLVEGEYSVDFALVEPYGGNQIRHAFLQRAVAFQIEKRERLYELNCNASSWGSVHF